MSKTYVTKSFMPPMCDYQRYLDEIFDTVQLTNSGPLHKKLEKELSDFLSVSNINLVSNGTIALQVALKALEIQEGEIITTPFSYVATVSSVLWERCKPVFVDIEPDNITSKTKAIMPVHVFGYACDVDKIQNIASKYNLKVIYDAAHTFGSIYQGKSLASYGDISTLSFHATKLFHTVEGGAIVIKDKDVFEKSLLIKAFGHDSDEHLCLGINAKMSEFHAGMGLANLPYIKEIIEKRKVISEKYDSLLGNSLKRPRKQQDLEYNYAYYPVVFE